MPKQVAINGPNPRITEENAIVNTQFADQTKTTQFVRWFGKGVVTENGASGGKPLVVYTLVEAGFEKNMPQMTDIITRQKVAGIFLCLISCKR